MPGTAAEIQCARRLQPPRQGFEPFQVGAPGVHAAAEIVRGGGAELARRHIRLFHSSPIV
jgi:hypothetical protein